MALETTLDVDAWVSDRICSDAQMQALFNASGSSGVRAYSTMAPQKPTYPVIVHGRQDSRDVSVMAGERIAIFPLYFIRVTGDGKGYFAIEPFAKRIDELVQQQGNAIGLSGDHYISKFIRQQDIMYPNVYDNVTYYTLGGLYKVMLCRA